MIRVCTHVYIRFGTCLSNSIQNRHYTMADNSFISSLVSTKGHHEIKVHLQLKIPFQVLYFHTMHPLTPAFTHDIAFDWIITVTWPELYDVSNHRQFDCLLNNSGYQQIVYQAPVLQVFCELNRQWPMDSTHKWPAIPNACPRHDVSMMCRWPDYSVYCLWSTRRSHQLCRFWLQNIPIRVCAASNHT